jgi:hypothetical protein
MIPPIRSRYKPFSSGAGGEKIRIRASASAVPLDGSIGPGFSRWVAVHSAAAEAGSRLCLEYGMSEDMP